MLPTGMVAALASLVVSLASAGRLGAQGAPPAAQPAPPPAQPAAQPATQPATQPAAQPAERPSAAPVAATSAATTAAGAPRPLSLDDAFTLAEARSEAVRIAQAAVLRGRGLQYQARAQMLPQINATAQYQRQLQNQFDAIQDQADESAPPPTQPVLSSVCAPTIAATATPEERAAALAAAQSCDQSNGDGLGSITRVFANPSTVVLGLSGSLNLFTGGRVLAGTRGAAAARRAAEIGLYTARAQLRLDVASAYYDAALADRLVAIAESSLVQSERTFRQTSLARSVGNTSEFELLRAQVSRDNQRPQVIQARANRVTSYLRLRQLLEMPADTPLQLTTELPEAPAYTPVRTAAAPAPPAPGAAPTPADATITRASLTNVSVDEALAIDPLVVAAVDSVVALSDTTSGSRAPVRQARENVDVQRQALKQARAQRWPAIQLQSLYQRFGYPEGDGIQFPNAWNQLYPNWTVSLGVSLPLFTGGRIRGEELVAQANVREAEQQALQVAELASLDAQVAVSELEQAAEAWRVSGGTSAQAARAYQIAEVRYNEGLSTQIELADSRLLLRQAQANSAQAARDLQVARLRVALLRDLPVQQQGAGSAALSSQQRGAAAGQGGAVRQPQQTQATTGASAFTNTGGTNP